MATVRYISKRPIDVYREEKNDRDSLYIHEKVKNLRVRRMNDELVLAKARDELIHKELIEKQAAYLLVNLRQRILAIPHAYARRILNLTDTRQSAKILKEMSISILNEIKDFPLKITDPHWLEKIEEKEAKNEDAGT